MSLLDGLKRKKTKPLRADVWDAPTLFGGVDNASPNAEKKISVLSAAGGKPARRAKPRHAAKTSGRMLRPGYVVLLVGTLVVAGIWQSGVLDRPAAVADKFDTLVQAGLSLFKPAGESASAHTVRTQVSTVTLPVTADAAEPDEAPPAQAAQIERVALAKPAESRTLEPAAPPAGAIEAALNTPGPVETAGLPTAAVPAARPRSRSSDTKMVSPQTPRASTRVADQTQKETAATEKPAERKPQVARTKEPDLDAQLLEALLVHLRKTESAQGSSR